MFNKRLFDVETPFMTSSSIEYLHNNNVNFLFEAYSINNYIEKFNLLFGLITDKRSFIVKQ